MAIRGNRLITTRTRGAPRFIVEGYLFGGGTPEYLTPGTQPDPDWPVIIFTDSAMQEKLDAEKPDWRTRNWTIINNSAETHECANLVRALMVERGTPLPDGG